MITPVDLSRIRNITISGRIASGTTTLASSLAEKLGWDLLEGGELFRKIHEELDLHEVESNHRPDKFDLEYEERIKQILKTKKHQVIQSHLAGFDAQGIPDVFKILVECVDEDTGEDMQGIRIDRLTNRKKLSIEEAKKEVRERETNNLEKWRRMYASGDDKWVYWDRKYYDFVVNTFSHDPQETLNLVLTGIEKRKSS
jgi:cytidylate kinase